MAIQPAGEVTTLLADIAAGNESAKHLLFERVYQELYAMAARQMKRERPGHTLGATGLVHEVYLRIQGQGVLHNRSYFFAAAAKAMYRILVEHARRTQKHHRNRETLVAVMVEELECAQRLRVLDLGEALETLKGYGLRGGRQHEVVVQRFFGGLSWRDIATNLGVSVATVEKDWQAARAWLRTRLRHGDTGDGR